MRVGERFRKMREAGHVSLSEVSKRSGVSTTKLSNAENGFATLTLQEEHGVGRAIVDLTHHRSSTVVELNEAERTRRESGRKVTVSEAARTKRRKELLIASGMTEKEAAIRAEIRGPRNGH